MRNFGTLLLVGFCATMSLVHAAEIPADGAKFHIFILAGQSNMAGRGVVEELDRQPHPRVLMLNKAAEWIPAIDPLHFDKPSIVGVGLGRTFAINYANAHPGVTVGLVPCAVGGSPISAWELDGYHEQTRTHPWNDAVPRMRSARESGTIKGVLWHQGESDANPKSSHAYEQKLHDLVARFRADLQSPALPFLVGQLGQFAERPWNEHRHRVNAAHQNLPNVLSKTAFVKSDDLTHKGDETHFDSRSYREFGHRFFAAWQSIADTTADATRESVPRGQD